MAITMEDMTAIKKELDDRYVMQSDCNERQEVVNKRFANDDKRIDVMANKFKVWDKLLWAIASSGVGALVIEIFNLIKG